MALPDYEDPTTGEDLPRPPNPDAPPDPDAQYREEQARQAQERRAWIAQEFERALGRKPADSEIDDALDFYTKNGGTKFQSWLKQRAGPGSFNWSDYGAPPDPFGEDYTPGTYDPEEFTEPFVAPTAESLYNDPGYKTRLDATQRGAERSAAARGSILSGGFVGRTLPRQLGEFASNEYSNAFGRAFDTYRQRYGQFSDEQARNADAFKTNEIGKMNQYTTRYGRYQDMITNRREAERDRWQREQDLAKLGLPSPP